MKEILVKRWAPALLMLMVGGALVGSAQQGDTAAAETSATAPAAGPLRLEVSLTDRTLSVFQGETLLNSYPVAIGADQHPTPRGTFSIRRVIWNPRWVPPNEPWAKGKTAKGPGEPGNPMGRVKIFFSEPDYYIHGTEDQASLGRAASHGCVRMANEDVVEVAKLVMEHGGQPRPANWFRRVINYVRSTQEVRLGNPVPVRVVG